LVFGLLELLTLLNRSRPMILPSRSKCKGCIPAGHHGDLPRTDAPHSTKGPPQNPPRLGE